MPQRKRLATGSGLRASVGSERVEIADPDNWAIIYTHNRDSGLLDQSNADAIAEALKAFSETDDADVVFESHDHWAVGHVDGFSIRVYRNGEITEAFKTYHDLMEQMDGYPILDEEDYSNREYEATLENISAAAWRVKHEYELPGWVGERGLLVVLGPPPECRRES